MARAEGIEPPTAELPSSATDLPHCSRHQRRSPHVSTLIRTHLGWRGVVFIHFLARDPGDRGQDAETAISSRAGRARRSRPVTNESAAFFKRDDRALRGGGAG